MFPNESAPNLLQGLNPEQLSAVTWPPQSALVLAGAGSGKTRVLTTRIAWLLQTGQASVHSIMAVTFTNKAAKEMQTRLGAMIPINVRAMWLGTFHGLCHRFLRLHHRDAGLPSSFQILDSGDQLSLIKRLLKNLNIAEEINALMKAASEEGRLKGVLGYNTLPLVSMDFNHTTQASTFDSTLTKVTEGKMVKVFAWYDNEWGFSCQMLNTARRMFGLEVRPF